MSCTSINDTPEIFARAVVDEHIIGFFKVLRNQIDISLPIEQSVGGIVSIYNMIVVCNKPLHIPAHIFIKNVTRNNVLLNHLINQVFEINRRVMDTFPEVINSAIDFQSFKISGADGSPTHRTIQLVL